MKITVHKGTHEIGGTCIELEAVKSSILLDLGSPLDEKSKSLETCMLHPDALFISHAHQDHYGLMGQLDASIPVFISQLGKNLIDATNVFLHRELPQKDFCFFRPWQPFQVQEFQVTPYLVDHSASDAYGFLIEAGTCRVFYTGDFRAHGRKGKLFEKILDNPPRDLDALIMEGTMMGRKDEPFQTEEAVEKAILDAIRDQTNMSFLISSSQNIDRVVSAYRACLQARKTLIVDLYTAWVLEQMKSVSNKVPNMEWEAIRVYVPYGQYKTVLENAGFFGDFQLRAFQQRITKEELWERRDSFLYLGKTSSGRTIDKYKSAGPVKVIYSQWLGYLESDAMKHPAYKTMADYRNDPGVEFIYAHTSGHAFLKDLQSFVRALEPKRLIPVHTEQGDSFADYFDNVIRLRDGEALNIP